jgi:hypothetical protein
MFIYNADKTVLFRLARSGVAEKPVGGHDVRAKTEERFNTAWLCHAKGLA